MLTHRNFLITAMLLLVGVSAYSDTEFLGELAIVMTDNSQQEIDG